MNQEIKQDVVSPKRCLLTVSGRISPEADTISSLLKRDVVANIGQKVRQAYITTRNSTTLFVIGNDSPVEIPSAGKNTISSVVIPAETEGGASTIVRG